MVHKLSIYIKRTKKSLLLLFFCWDFYIRATVFIVKNNFGLLIAIVLRIKKYILVTAITLIIVKVLKIFPLSLRSPFRKLFRNIVRWFIFFAFTSRFSCGLTFHLRSSIRLRLVWWWWLVWFSKIGRLWLSNNIILISHFDHRFFRTLWPSLSKWVLLNIWTKSLRLSMKLRLSRNWFHWFLLNSSR